MEYEVIVRVRIKAEDAEAAAESVQSYLEDTVDSHVLDYEIRVEDVVTKD